MTEDRRLELIALLAQDKSWDAVVLIGTELLDAHYPADIFTGISGDPGPAYVVALRNALAALRASPPEPVVDDVWDGVRAEYVTTVSYADRTVTIRPATSGAFRGDYEILGPGWYSDGHLTLDLAIARATEWLTGDGN